MSAEHLRQTTRTTPSEDMEEQGKSQGPWKMLFLFLFLPFIGYGLYNAFKVVQDRNTLAETGRRTAGLIKTTSKGKCGLGYGYSATFTYEVNSRTLTGKCECESRAWVEPGDQYLVAYNSDQPEKVHLFADSLISATDSVQSP